MKRGLMLSVIMLFIAAGYAGAADKAAPAKAVVVQPVAPVPDLLATKKADLNNTEWTIDVKVMGVSKAKGEKDTLSFLDGKISSANLGKAGYSTTNYSARILEDNETLTWETMQTSEKDGVAFWRGDIGPDGVMRGVLSKRDKKDKTSDFNFVSTGSKKVAPVAAPAPAAEEKDAAK